MLVRTPRMAADTERVGRLHRFTHGSDHLTVRQQAGTLIMTAIQTSINACGCPPMDITDVHPKSYG
jgi:hypothetical protein